MKRGRLMWLVPWLLLAVAAFTVTVVIELPPTRPAPAASQPAPIPRVAPTTGAMEQECGPAPDHYDAVWLECMGVPVIDFCLLPRDVQQAIYQDTDLTGPACT